MTQEGLAFTLSGSDYFVVKSPDDLQRGFCCLCSSRYLSHALRGVEKLCSIEICVMYKHLDVMYKRQGNVGPCERHMLTTMLLRPRRLSSTVKEVFLLPAGAPRAMKRLVVCASIVACTVEGFAYCCALLSCSRSDTL